MKETLKKENAITLIALIITVVILILVAGISISQISGDGLVSRTLSAREQAEIQQNKETIQAAIVQAKALNRYGKLVKQELEEELNKEGYTVDIMQSMSNLIIHLEDTDRYYEATSGGKVDKIDILEMNVNVAEKFEDGEYTWEDIHNMAKIISGSFSLDASGINKTTSDVNIIYNKKMVELSVGDEFILKDTYNNSYRVRILGFNTDKLAEESNVEGDTTYTGTYAGISFEFVDFFKYDGTHSNAAINPATDEYPNGTTVGGWAETQMRRVLNGNKENEIIGAVELLENTDYIKTVTKIYNTGNRGTTNSTCDDKLWLLACSEIWADGAIEGGYGQCKTNESMMYNPMDEETRYKYYAVANNSYNTNPQDATKKYGNYQWLLRSPCRYDASIYLTAGRTGCGVVLAKNDWYYVAPRLLHLASSQVNYEEKPA